MTVLKSHGPPECESNQGNHTWYLERTESSAALCGDPTELPFEATSLNLRAPICIVKRPLRPKNKDHPPTHPSPLPRPEKKKKKTGRAPRVAIQDRSAGQRHVASHLLQEPQSRWSQARRGERLTTRVGGGV